LLSRSANIYARLLTGIPLHDLTGGFKCFQREALKCLDLASIRSEGYAFQIETTFRVYQQGLTVSEIPIIFKERVEGVSKISRNVVFEAVLIVARLGFERLFHRKKRKI
jgi:dolichol-phosphate mannosyltransferase